MTIRQKILEISYKAGACHIGSALSCVEILEAIDCAKREEDIFIWSKASGIAAYYAREYDVDKGVKLLKKYPLPSKEAGLIWTGGSLGQGLSVACGLALADRSKTVIVLMSDGELQEGQVWEAAMFAAHHKLKNLIAVVDRNRFQALGDTEKINALEPLEEKFQAFGWCTTEVDGHDIKALSRILKRRHMPHLIIANTIKGKGVSFMEGNNDWHYKNLTKEGYDASIRQV